MCSSTEMGAPGASHLGTGDHGPKTRPKQTTISPGKRASLSLMRRRQQIKKIVRKPSNRRKRRSSWLRLFVWVRGHRPGAHAGLDLGGTTGIMLNSHTICRVSSLS